MLEDQNFLKNYKKNKFNRDEKKVSEVFENFKKRISTWRECSVQFLRANENR